MTLMARNQTATYWAPEGNGAWGEPGWSEPAVLRVRWQEQHQMVRNNEGQEVVSDTVVYTGQSLDLDGRLLRGIHDDAEPPEQARRPLKQSEHVDMAGNTDHWKLFL